MPDDSREVEPERHEGRTCSVPKLQAGSVNESITRKSTEFDLLAIGGDNNVCST